jgi:hypothetical protein
MRNRTPPRSWDDRESARRWLSDFVTDVVGYESWTIADLNDMYDEALIKVRRGWRTGVVLRKPFRRNPDALAEFIEEFLAKRKGQD